ncbi:MAG TPA: DoxX family protein [Burkholderiales bacterium]
MQAKQATLQSYTPYALAALRIVTAYLFIQHGTAKLFGFPYQSMFDGLELFSLVGLAGVLEVAGGLLIGAGLYTRSTAFVMSGLMAVAYFMAHATQGNVLAPMLNGGELAALYSFVFLLLVFAGPGALSLDGRKSAAAGSTAMEGAAA